RKAYRKLTNDKKNEYIKARTFTLKLACDDRDPRTFWNVLKDGSKNSTCLISAQEWFEYFSDLYNIDAGPRENNIDERTEEIVDDLLDSPITSSEIYLSIKDLKNEKSPGIDGIPAELFKVASDKFIPYLVLLFNKMYDLSVFPMSWAKSIISPIHKKGDSSVPNNFRGICLQPVLSKVFTSILNRRLRQWSLQTDALGEEQAGFRRTYSTIDNLFCLQTIITKYLRHKGGRVYAIFVDFEKAFDRIDRDILWYKLNSSRIGSVQKCLKC
ncbi:MAG: reverse transcriptase family protein, partial [Candidatus Thiodiazotropha sp.]